MWIKKNTDGKSKSNAAQRWHLWTNLDKRTPRGLHAIGEERPSSASYQRYRVQACIAPIKRNNCSAVQRRKGAGSDWRGRRVCPLPSMKEAVVFGWRKYLERGDASDELPTFSAATEGKRLGSSNYRRGKRNRSVSYAGEQDESPPQLLA